MKLLRCLPLLLGVCISGCQTPVTDHAGPLVKPRGMSDEDYVLAQLETLGCAGNREKSSAAPVSRSSRKARLLRENFRSPLLRGLPVQRMSPAISVQSTVASGLDAGPASSGPTYVQKLGNTYYGTDGSANWQSGRVMINADGPAGTLIGNTLISR